MKKYIYSLLSVMAVNAIAENSDQSEIPNIIVSGTRSEVSSTTVPAGIQVITRQDILDSGAVHLVEVLRSAAGLQIKDLYGDGSRASIDMRGFGGSASSNVLVLVNGRRLNNTDTKGADLNSIALRNIERIEMMNGSSGTLYGDQAVGGVVNIITRSTGDFDVDASITAGSYNRRGVQGSISNRFENGLAFSVNTELRSADNYREHNQQEYTQLGGRLDFNYTQGLLFVDIQSVDEDLQSPGALLQHEANADRRQSRLDYANDYSHLKTNNLGLGFEQALSEQLQFLMDYNHREGEGDFVLNFRGCAASPFFPCNTVPDTDARKQRSINPKLVGNFDSSSGNIVLTVGVDIDEHDYNLDSLFVKISNEQEVNSIYGHVLLPISDSLTLKTGVRSAQVENNLIDMGSYPAGIKLKDDVTVGEFGLNWQAVEGVRVFTRIDQNYRFAKADEQNFTTVGVVGLKTQEGDSVEAGLDIVKNIFNVQLLTTRLKLENEIAFDPTANGPFGPFGGANVNFDKTQRDTVSIRGGFDLSDSFSLNGSIHKVDAEFKSGIFTGKDVSGVADVISKLSLNYAQSERWSAYLEAQRTGRQYRSGDNANAQDKQDSYTVINMSVNFSLRQWLVSARINNLSDRAYIESANAFGALQPSPERNIAVTLRYLFK